MFASKNRTSNQKTEKGYKMTKSETLLKLLQKHTSIGIEKLSEALQSTESGVRSAAHDLREKGFNTSVSKGLVILNSGPAVIRATPRKNKKVPKPEHEKSGISKKVLVALQANPGISPKSLSQVVGVPLGSVYSAVNNLRGDGLFILKKNGCYTILGNPPLEGGSEEKPEPKKTAKLGMFADLPYDKIQTWPKSEQKDLVDLLIKKAFYTLAVDSMIQAHDLIDGVVTKINL